MSADYTPLTQADVERRIMALSDTMESETHTYRQQAREAAEAEADYKLAHHRQIIAIAATGTKQTAAVREARAALAVADDYRLAKIKAAQLDATKQLLSTLRAQLDAVRTLAANVRHQT